MGEEVRESTQEEGKIYRCVLNCSLAIAFSAGTLAHRYKISDSSTFDMNLHHTSLGGLYPQTATILLASFPCSEASSFLN